MSTIGGAMNVATFRLYHVNFEAGGGIGVIRRPGERVCGEIIQINQDQLDEIKKYFCAGKVPAHIIEKLSHAF